MTCTIKLKPALQEFVRYAYLNGESKVTAADTFGKLIKPWLSLPPRGYVPVASTLPDEFTFELPQYSDKNTTCNFYIYPHGQAYIATILDAIFREQLNVHLDSILARCANLQIKANVAEFSETKLVVECFFSPDFTPGNLLLGPEWLEGHITVPVCAEHDGAWVANIVWKAAAIKHA